MADDEEFCIASMKVMLAKATVDSSNIDFAIDGKECLQMVENTYQKGGKYELILTDFNMPKLNGLESTIEIRAFLTLLDLPIELQPIIIGLTGHVAESYSKAGQEAGMTEIYGKPLYFEVLEQILEKYYFK